MLLVVLISILSLLSFYLSYLIVCLYLHFNNVENFYNLPKTLQKKEKVFIFWNQGWKDAPYICKMCLKSWKKYNGDTYDIVELDNETISHYILDQRVVKTINNIANFTSWTQASDLLRINLMAIHGGFWVDSTLLCTKPINEYKHLIQNKYNFWCPFDIDNTLHSYNFIYSRPNNAIIKKVTHSLNQHFYNKPIDTYASIYHLYVGREMFDRIEELINWNVIKGCQLTVSSNRQKLGYKMFANSKDLLLQKITNETITNIDKQFFLKLTTRHGIKDYGSFETGTVIDYLIRKYT